MDEQYWVTAWLKVMFFFKKKQPQLSFTGFTNKWLQSNTDALWTLRVLQLLKQPVLDQNEQIKSEHYYVWIDMSQKCFYSMNLQFQNNHFMILSHICSWTWSDVSVRLSVCVIFLLYELKITARAQRGGVLQSLALFIDQLTKQITQTICITIMT